MFQRNLCQEIACSINRDLQGEKLYITHICRCIWMWFFASNYRTSINLITITEIVLYIYACIWSWTLGSVVLFENTPLSAEQCHNTSFHSEMFSIMFDRWVLKLFSLHIYHWKKKGSIRFVPLTRSHYSNKPLIPKCAQICPSTVMGL